MCVNNFIVLFYTRTIDNTVQVDMQRDRIAWKTSLQRMTRI